MLEELIKCFYDENGYLKEEGSITFTKEAMTEIIKEVASLKLDLVAKSVTADEL